MHTTNSIKIFIAILLNVAVAASAYAGQPLDRIVAVVNGDAISKSELDNYTKLVISDIKQTPGTSLPTKDVLQQQVLSRMVMDKIQLQLAQQYGIEVDSLTVSQAVQNIAKQQNETVESLKSSLEARGINYSDYREVIRTELIVQNLQNKEVSQEITITKADIENFLSSPAGQDHSGAEYRLSHILLPISSSPSPEALRKAQTQAEQVVAGLKKGDDFKHVAMTKSAGRQALKGGDLGWRTTGELPTLFVSYVPTMSVGEIAGPIHSSSGFHIIKLQEKRVASQDQRSETHVRQILIKPDANTSSKEAEQILRGIKQQLKKGGDFAKLAVAKSQENRTAEHGGDLGWVNEGSVLPKFYQVMVKLRNNEISEPFETEDGWHLIQVLERRTQFTSNEAAWNKAREILTVRKANEALESWSKRIRDEARVEIYLDPESTEKNA